MTTDRNSGMRIAELHTGQWVTLDVDAPVFKQGKLIGFNGYVIDPREPDGHHAIKVFKPL